MNLPIGKCKILAILYSVLISTTSYMAHCAPTESLLKLDRRVASSPLNLVADQVHSARQASSPGRLLRRDAHVSDVPQNFINGAPAAVKSGNTDSSASNIAAAHGVDTTTTSEDDCDKVHTEAEPVAASEEDGQLYAAFLSNEDRELANVTLKYPVRVVRMLNQLMHDIAWSMFVENFK